MLQLETFQQSTTSVVLLQGRPQPSAGVGANVFDVVYVCVPVGVTVMVAVKVREIVLVLHGVQVRESVGGQVMVGVGENGLTQHIVSSTHERQICCPDSGVRQKELTPPETYPGKPPK